MITFSVILDVINLNQEKKLEKLLTKKIREQKTADKTGIMK